MAIKDWATTGSANTSIDAIYIGENAPYANMNDMGRAIMANVRQEIADQGATVTAATLATISGASQFKLMDGNTTVSGFDTAVTGLYRELKITGTPKFLNSSGLAIQGGSDYQAAVGDIVRTRSLGAGNWILQPPSVDTRGKHLIPILAASMQAATTNGAAAGAVETTTNKVLYRTLDFDTSTQEFAGFVLPMPSSWNEGTITFRALWTAASGSGGVAWALQAIALSDDDATDQAYGTEQVVTDTLLTAGDVHRTSESSAITIAGSPAASDLVFFRVKRVPANASDTLGVDARLIAVELFITTDAGADT